MKNQKMLEKIRDGSGFVAALDQSGGSTPKVLSLYGVDRTTYTNENEMFGLVHQMRSRIITSPSFSGERIIGTILFEMTMDLEILGIPTAEYLWQRKNIVPFVKIDEGLGLIQDGVQLMLPIPKLEGRLKRAANLGVFGTKERSVISAANATGIANAVAQQFEIGLKVLDQDLVPILEPEVTINIPDKAEAEFLLLDEILKGLDTIPNGRKVMIKLSLPTIDNHYRSLVDHPNVLRVLALSGGYARSEANTILARNAGIAGCFSRGLCEGLSFQQSQTEFNTVLDSAVRSISDATLSS